MSGCATCGAELAPNKAPGRVRKFCSERCRKAQYAGICVDCGAQTNGGDGRGSNAPKRCLACSTEYARQGWIARCDQRRERIAALWAAGQSMREIASDLDTTISSLGVTMHSMRKYGWDLPYRYRAYEGRRVAA